jgi:hypothetical protein
MSTGSPGVRACRSSWGVSAGPDCSESRRVRRRRSQRRHGHVCRRALPRSGGESEPSAALALLSRIREPRSARRDFRGRARPVSLLRECAIPSDRGVGWRPPWKPGRRSSARRSSHGFNWASVSLPWKQVACRFKNLIKQWGHREVVWVPAWHLARASRARPYLRRPGSSAGFPPRRPTSRVTSGRAASASRPNPCGLVTGAEAPSSHRAGRLTGPSLSARWPGDARRRSPSPRPGAPPATPASRSAGAARAPASRVAPG